MSTSEVGPFSHSISLLHLFDTSLFPSFFAFSPSVSELSPACSRLVTGPSADVGMLLEAKLKYQIYVSRTDEEGTV